MRSQPAAAPSGFFVLRTPLLPFTAVTGWSDGLQAPAAWRHADSGLLDDAVAADRTQLRRRLEDIVTTPAFRDALYVASPSLAAAVDPWRKEPDGDKGRATERALVSYFMRAAARPTPFGLFAGCTTGTIGERTQLRLAGVREYERHTRLDMDFLWELAEAIERDPSLGAGLSYRPNSSLYQSGDRLLFAEARLGRGGRRYRLVAVEPTPYLTATLERARDGARLSALADALVTGDVTLAEADEYIAELAVSQLLVADIKPQLTGPPPTEAFVTALARHERGVGLARRLSQAAGQLAAIDADGIGVPAERYRAVAELLGELPVSPEPSRFVQVDVTKPAAEATLGAGVVAELRRGAGILHALTRYRRPEGLHQFREQFTRRYETREVPLAQALDEENGIGFERSSAPSAEAAPLLAGVPLHPPQDQSVPWSRRDAFLLGKLTRALAAGSREITIDAAEAAAAADGDIPPLPDAFEVVATIMPSPGTGDEGRPGTGDEARPGTGGKDGPAPGTGRGAWRRATVAVLHSASGPSGARLLGRFCHADGELRRLVRAHLAAEEAVHPDRVFAEVVHLPEGRVGNILCRPVLRGYEIPYLGRSGAPADRQLPLSDLLVSVQDERIVLRSRRLGREVVPRLTTAHNHVTRGLGVYRFLGALQSQHVTPGVTWDWGPLAQAPFLPRVVSGRVILSRARWNLTGDDLAAFREPPGETPSGLRPSGARQFAAVQRLRERCRLPRYVALADGENELAVDLDNVLSLEMLAHEVRGRTYAVLVEMVPGPDELCSYGPEGAFTHQVIIPFVRTPQPEPEPMPRSEPAPAAVRAATPGARRFPPGSEWLYVKLFTGPATADQVLRRIASVLTWALTAGGADQWFFLRYGDPDWHLRLRIHGAPNRLLHETLPLLTRVTAPLLDTGELWRLQLDTYEREVERYGGPTGIRLAERVFHADSDAVLAIVRDLTGDAGAELRWRVALRGVDLLFDDLGLTLEQKRDIAAAAQHGYGREFGVGGAFQQEVSRRYRGERAAVEALLDPDRDPPAELAASLRALHQRSAALAWPARELRAAAKAGRLTVSLPELALSLAHLHVNRVLRSSQRAQELVIYEMLGRAYRSQAARRPR
jgi:thiopeptide-type bacteriocin biosynthesis protein